MSRRVVTFFALGFLAGCSLSLGLNGESGRPCSAGKCLDGFVCFKEVCVPLAGAQCKTAGDCPSGNCVDGGCQLPPCQDNTRNYRESDVDCGGGFCGRCVDGKGCTAAGDCLSSVCGLDGGTDAGTCQIPSCTDGVTNGTETDLDCGGDAGCPRCADGLLCKAGTDCVTGSCSDVCQPGACIDMVKNGPETDVDCGGPCKKCLDGKGCLVGKDCASGVCTTLHCAVPTCNDTVKNGPETDVDCGGGSCNGCADTRVCAGDNDCANKVCQNATCRPAHCANGTRDVDESDKDCGGSCQKCGLTKNCLNDSDCTSNNCWSSFCIP